ncbi:MAG: TraR/DksA C4-type zinc finger protein [Gammaproteobacteria bacterium]
MGTYGRCIDCGKDIGQKRLNAVPAASRCFDCQTNFEHADRREHHRSL